MFVILSSILNQVLLFLFSAFIAAPDYSLFWDGLFSNQTQVQASVNASIGNYSQLSLTQRGEHAEIEQAKLLTPMTKEIKNRIWQGRLVDIKGSCSGLRARFMTAEKTFFGFSASNPCDAINLFQPISKIAKDIKARLVAGESPIISLNALSPYKVLYRNGDCNDMIFDIKDPFLESSYTFYIKDVCKTLNLSDKSLALKVILSQLYADRLLIENDKSFYENRCDYRVSPKDYINKINAISKTAGQWRTICFSEGYYDRPLWLDGYQALILLGKENARFSSKVAPPESGQVPHIKALIDIKNGNNIAVSHLSVSNLYAYKHVKNQTLQVSRALAFAKVDNVHIRSSTITSYGKQTIFSYRNKFVHLRHSIVSSAYFAGSFGLSGNVLVESSTLKQSLEGDHHSLIHTFKTSHYYRNIKTYTATGRSFISGSNKKENNIRIENLTSADNKLHSWTQQHPNFPFMRIFLYGDYPDGVKDFYYNKSGGGGIGQGSFVLKKK